MVDLNIIEDLTGRTPARGGGGWGGRGGQRQF